MTHSTAIARHPSNSRLDNLALVSLRHQCLVMPLLATRLALVDVLVLPLEAATVLFLLDDLLQESLLAFLVVQAAAVELGRALNDGADL